MTLVFTICSSNYLAQAKVLGDSLAKSNPDCRFVIGLVDRIPDEVDFDTWMPHEVLPVTDINIDGFDEMSAKYNIVELNTAVKPFYMEYFYEQDVTVDHVFYIDPDILVLGSFASLVEKLKSYNIIVTPHSCTYDNSEVNISYEWAMLRAGIYNLGFIATARSAETSAFLKWWQIRLREYCYYLTQPGLFVDQIWVTLAQLYFKGFYVEKDPGYNMSYWNLFERLLSSDSGKYKVNKNHDLIFYHFSSYNPHSPEAITGRDSGEIIATFDERPDLQPLFDDYCKRMIDAGISDVSSIQCAYGRRDTPKLKEKPKLISVQSAKDIVNALLRISLRVIPKRVRMCLKNNL